MTVYLASSRISLRAHALENAVSLCTWKNDSEIVRMSSDQPHTETLDQTRTSLQRWISSKAQDAVHFAIHLTDDRFIGFGHLALIDKYNESCRLGIVVGEKSLWGQGYGSEATDLMLRFAFEILKLHRVSCETYDFNIRSNRMLMRLGFVREGVLRQSIKLENGFADQLCYGLLRSEFRGGQQ